MLLSFVRVFVFLATVDTALSLVIVGWPSWTKIPFWPPKADDFLQQSDVKESSPQEPTHVEDTQTEANEHITRNEFCSLRYTTQRNSTCDQILERNSLTLEKFLHMNPSLHGSCKELPAGTTVCVKTKVIVVDGSCWGKPDHIFDYC
ncbi:hypothetical protein CDD83_5441 [Cordyceps sp. RAO-2017]|nr:hypothetical protein CDD83_5441 [Cordyceps sp. RAO-2017]